jgi:hypothetical protein
MVLDRPVVYAMKSNTPSLGMHSRMLDPVVDEIFRVFKILQNEDGSWGREENKYIRAFTTSWVLRALEKQNEEEVFNKGVEYFKTILESIQYAPAEHMSDVGEAFLKGLFNASDVLLRSSLMDKSRLKRTYLDVLKKLREASWLSSTSLAAYVIFGLKDTNIETSSREEAKKFLMRELIHDNVNLATVSPDVCLAVPDVLKGFLVNPENFLTQIGNVPDLRAVHIMLALAELSRDSNLPMIQSIRTRVLENFRRRQITEIDRKITKTLLDLTLLLKSGQRGTSLAKKVKDYSPLIEVQSGSGQQISFKMNLNKFTEDLGQLDLCALASYAFAISLLKQEYVYLLDESEYNDVKEFFTNKTIAVSKKRETVNECIGVMILASSYVLFLYGLTLVLPNFAQGFPIIRGNEFAMAASIASFAFGTPLYKLRLLGKLFPLLSQIVKARIGRE